MILHSTIDTGATRIELLETQRMILADARPMLKRVWSGRVTAAMCIAVVVMCARSIGADVLWWLNALNAFAVLVNTFAAFHLTRSSELMAYSWHIARDRIERQLHNLDEAEADYAKQAHPG